LSFSVNSGGWVAVLGDLTLSGAVCFAFVAGVPFDVVACLACLEVCFVRIVADFDARASEVNSVHFVAKVDAIAEKFVQCWFNACKNDGARFCRSVDGRDLTCDCRSGGDDRVS
jgi:hypothetical protein